MSGRLAVLHGSADEPMTYTHNKLSVFSAEEQFTQLTACMVTKVVTYVEGDVHTSPSKSQQRLAEREKSSLILTAAGRQYHRETPAPCLGHATCRETHSHPGPHCLCIVCFTSPGLHAQTPDF